MDHGKLAVLDLGEPGRQIGEKLFILLDAEQQRELTHYVLTRNKQDCTSAENSYAISHTFTPQADVELPLTEIHEGDLYFCLEERKVLYDANSLSILDIDKITALSSIIHQNVYMFDESIFDNICLHEDYSEKELQSALSDSGLSSFIKQVPNGLEYHVGENGANLSGGQKQRIAVARALIRKKPLLILDEGTSAIDMQTAYDIESRLLAISDLTLLTITHNMSKDILELYDEIIFMADGKIIEHGTFETLIAKHAAFYDFYQLKK